jgi:hypothetical protein
MNALAIKPPALALIRFLLNKIAFLYFLKKSHPGCLSTLQQGSAADALY